MYYYINKLKKALSSQDFKHFKQLQRDDPKLGSIIRQIQDTQDKNIMPHANQYTLIHDTLFSKHNKIIVPHTMINILIIETYLFYLHFGPAKCIIYYKKTSSLATWIGTYDYFSIYRSINNKTKSAMGGWNPSR